MHQLLYITEVYTPLTVKQVKINQSY